MTTSKCSKKGVSQLSNRSLHAGAALRVAATLKKEERDGAPLPSRSFVIYMVYMLVFTGGASRFFISRRCSSILRCGMPFSSHSFGGSPLR